jgi:peroxiredoxin
MHTAAFAFLVLFAPALATPAAELGRPAPDFALKALDGKQVKLVDFKGKKVVLEWFNPECPFVVYAHTKGPLTDMAEQHARKGVVWLAINSGAPGKQGTGLERNAAMARQYGIKHPVLLDESGVVGRSYGATATPHMYVINEQGVLVYSGALDNAPRGDAQGAKPLNYVAQALAELATQKTITVPATRPYGCSVKYTE